MIEDLVKCEDCKVMAKIVPFGYGYVAICPECKTILYNEPSLPEVKEKQEV